MRKLVVKSGLCLLGYLKYRVDFLSVDCVSSSKDQSMIVHVPKNVRYLAFPSLLKLLRGLLWIRIAFQLHFRNFDQSVREELFLLFHFCVSVQSTNDIPVSSTEWMWNEEEWSVIFVQPLFKVAGLMVKKQELQTIRNNLCI